MVLGMESLILSFKNRTYATPLLCLYCEAKQQMSVTGNIAKYLHSNTLASIATPLICACQVQTCMFAVGTVSQKNGYQGPTIGTKISKANPRDWSEEQLKAGDTIIGQQMSCYKGATQAGMNIGKNRNIID